MEIKIVKMGDSKTVKPRIYAACGTDDSMLSLNRQFRDEVQPFHFDFTYEEWSGNHDWYYFK